MVDRTHEFISAGSKIDDSAPLFSFKQSYNSNRLGKINMRDDYLQTNTSLNQDEIRPGMDEIEGAFYDASSDKHEHLNKIHGEYGDHNIFFWSFMFGALFASFLTFLIIIKASKERLFTALEKPKFSPDPRLVIFGLVGFFFITAFVCYYNFKSKNGPTFRHGSLFLMVVLWGLALWWTVLFYGYHSEKDASFILFLGIVILIVWSWMIVCKGKHDTDNVWLLILSISWLLYLLYYNIGILNNNKLPLNLILDSQFGDRGARKNRFERFRRHTIV